MFDFLRKKINSWGYYHHPEFMIIGAQKCGTSALYGMLSSHPQLHGSREKETNFFSEKIDYGLENIKNYGNQYPIQIGKRSSGTKCFEASPNYLYYPKTARRLFEYNPDLKMIVLLRNPVHRAFSAYTMYRNFKDHKNPNYRFLYENRTFDEIIREDIPIIPYLNPHNDIKGIISRGIYFVQLLNYITYFERKNILVLEQSELLMDTLKTLNHVTSFLGINEYKPEYLLNPKVSQRKNESIYRENISEYAEEELTRFYAPFNQKLYSLIGTEYNW